MTKNELASGIPAAADFYEYITKDGDRWDLIAYEFYSDATLYEGIITANPEVAIIPILPSGLKLKIPVIEDNNQIQFELPPWRL
ncbi:MAG: tail protein X [bacterium]